MANAYLAWLRALLLSTGQALTMPSKDDADSGDASIDRRGVAGSVNSSPEPTNWNILDSVDVNRLNVGAKYAVVILNRPVEVPPRLMIELWNHAKLRVTVDGGTTRWYCYCEHLQSCGFELSIVHPDVASGDFDSIHPGVLKSLENTGCKIYRTPDQNYTDFRKALNIVAEKEADLDSVVVVAEHSGRLDHIVGNINVHFKVDEIFKGRKVLLYHLSGDSISWLLRPGKHSIKIPNRLREHSVWCSMLPFGSPCSISSSGLMYNMNNLRSEFGGLISSSNTYDSSKEEVELTIDGNIIWSMGLGFEKGD